MFKNGGQGLFIRVDGILFSLSMISEESIIMIIRSEGT